MTHRILPASAHGPASVELRFAHRRNDCKSLAFPCDAAGRVDLDALDERSRNEYLFARALMGHDYAFPVMAPCDPSSSSGRLHLGLRRAAAAREATTTRP